ncbi:hypothetical protein CAPN010_07760 [Capnocytophaga cynodegmi]|nr:hypothetical protein CAPN010_07760 [Capnocytophaga cynodegmi]
MSKNLLWLSPFSCAEAMKATPIAIADKIIFFINKLLQLNIFANIQKNNYEKRKIRIIYSKRVLN